MQRETGRFTKVVEARKFAFVSPDHDPSIWVFVHFSELPDGDVPEVGGRCAYDRLNTEKGPRAVNVDLLPEYADAA